MHQGARPNYQSTIAPLTYRKRAYEIAEHETWVAGAVYDLSEITERASRLIVRVIGSRAADSGL